MRQLLARGGDVRLLRSRGSPRSSSTARLHHSVEWSARGGRARPTAWSCSPQHRQFLEQPLWDEAQLVVDTRNVVPAGPERPPRSRARASRLILVLGAGYLGARARASVRSRRATRSCSPTTGTRPSASSSPSSSAQGARVETADIRNRERPRRGCSPSGPERVFLLAAQASRPLSEREPDYTEETNVTGARRVAEAVAARGGPRSSSPARCTSTAPASTRRGGRRPPLRPAGRPRAPLEGLRGARASSMHARRGGFDLALLRLGIVYGPSPVEHERAGVADGRRQVPPAGRGRGSSSRSTTAERRRSASSTSRTRRASCSTPEPAGRRVATSPPRRSPSPTSPRSREASEPPATPACTFATPFDYRHTVRGVPRAPMRAPRHRRDRASSAGAWPTCSRSAGTRSSRVARPGGAARARSPGSTRSSVDAGDPAARDADRGLRRRAATSPASPTRRARARTRPGRCARTRARRSTCSRAAWSTAAGSSIPSTRPRRARPAARRLRALEAARRGGLPPPPGARDRRPAHLGLRARARSPGRARPARSRPSPRARSRASRSSIPGDPRAHARLRLRRRPRAGARGDRRRGRAGTRRFTLASGVATPLLRAAELVRDAAGSDVADRDARRELSRRARTRATRRGRRRRRR